MFGDSEGKAIRTSTIRTYVEGLRKKNNRGRISIEELTVRAESKKDLWTGLPLYGNDLDGAMAAQYGKQEKPPISEGCLTVEGLKEAKKEGKAVYNVLCTQLDKYLEGGEKERQKLERSANF